MLLQNIILVALALLASAMPALGGGTDEIPSNNAAASYLDIKNIYHANRKESQEAYLRIISIIDNVQIPHVARVEIFQEVIRFIRREIHDIEKMMNETLLSREEVIEAGLLRSVWLARLERLIVIDCSWRRRTCACCVIYLYLRDN
jgi:hypothetical protein